MTCPRCLSKWAGGPFSRLAGWHLPIWLSAFKPRALTQPVYTSAAVTCWWISTVPSPWGSWLSCLSAHSPPNSTTKMLSSVPVGAPRFRSGTGAGFLQIDRSMCHNDCEIIWLFPCLSLPSTLSSKQDPECPVTWYVHRGDAPPLPPDLLLLLWSFSQGMVPPANQ